MADIPYVPNNGKIPEYFGKIQTVGVPDALTQKWLESIGFKSKNDRYMVAFLKDLGFADSSGKPTKRWHDYRHKDVGKGVMAEAIRETYSALFNLYEDAHQKDDEAIRNWMRTHSPKASPTTIDRGVASFRGLCKLADFDALGSLAVQVAAEMDVAPVLPSAGFLGVTSPGGWTVNINVELQLPQSATAEDYNNFFEAMRRHLIDGPAEAS
jgi:hypothetical protein